MSNNPLDEHIHTIIALIESGTPPWRQPWKHSSNPSLPLRNNGLAYSGVNQWLLSYFGAMSGFASPYWVTFQQALAVGACVRKGSKGFPAILYKTRVLDAETDEEDGKVLRFLKRYVVFNGDQLDNCPKAWAKAPPIDEDLRTALRNTVLDAVPAEIRLGGSRAFYSPAGDFIALPPPEAFETVDHFQSTKCHELGHWTGGPSRLNRNLGGRFGDKDYGYEELVAELISVGLGLQLGLSPDLIEDHASYLGAWAKKISERPAILLEASSDAQRGIDHILSYSNLVNALPLDEAA